LTAGDGVDLVKALGRGLIVEVNSKGDVVSLKPQPTK